VARVPIYSWEDFMKLGKDVPDSAVRARIDGRGFTHALQTGTHLTCSALTAQRPGECCTLIYTR
jgi:hypothetical protein